MPQTNHIKYAQLLLPCQSKPMNRSRRIGQYAALNHSSKAPCSDSLMAKLPHPKRQLRSVLPENEVVGAFAPVVDEEVEPANQKRDTGHDCVAKRGAEADHNENDADSCGPTENALMLL